jgi:dUTP pyrophosphatase
MKNNENIDNSIKELKELQNLDILPPETKEEIGMAITFAEGLKNYGGATTELKSDYKLPIKFVNTSEYKSPMYAKEGDSGFDLRVTEGGTLKPLERHLVPTGLFFELPDGYELQIRPRSGLAYKHGITILNSPGTVDTGYRGEIKLLLVNLSNEEFSWKAGERMAQGVVAHRVSSDFGALTEVAELTDSKRGATGWGSTGVQ